ncbi:MAG: hypothetical protein LBL01_05850 [Bifidobacteriaceae bacterium]|nr:hypothetical protein [Bifidobacteriaceae bacterium]
MFGPVFSPKWNRNTTGRRQVEQQRSLTGPGRAGCDSAFGELRERIGAGVLRGGGRRGTLEACPYPKEDQ